MIRREFPKAVRVEIVKRAITGSAGVMPCCEKCGLPVFSGKFEIDHRNPDAMQIDKSQKLTAADGWLLCLPCHAEKTKKDVADIAKAKRREAIHLGVTQSKGQIKSRGFAKRDRAHADRQPLPRKDLFRDEN